MMREVQTLRKPADVYGHFKLIVLTVSCWTDELYPLEFSCLHSVFAEIFCSGSDHLGNF